MSLFKQRTDYFKSLAEKNKLLAHGHTIDGAKRKTFFRMNDEEELKAATMSSVQFPCMVFTGTAGRYTTAYKSVPKRRMVTSLFFLAKAKASDMDGVETAYDTAFEAMEQIISALWNDYNTTGHCGPFYDLDLSRFSFSPVDDVALNLVGWELSIEDDSSTNTITNYDASKWF